MIQSIKGSEAILHDRKFRWPICVLFCCYSCAYLSLTIVRTFNNLFCHFTMDFFIIFHLFFLLFIIVHWPCRTTDETTKTFNIRKFALILFFVVIIFVIIFFRFYCLNFICFVPRNHFVFFSILCWQISIMRPTTEKSVKQTYRCWCRCYCRRRLIHLIYSRTQNVIHFRNVQRTGRDCAYAMFNTFAQNEIHHFNKANVMVEQHLFSFIFHSILFRCVCRWPNKRNDVLFRSI